MRSRADRSHDLVSLALAEAASARGERTSFTCTGAPQHTSSGLSVVHLRQEYAGIPVRDGVRSVRFARDGSVLELTGRSLSVAEGTPVVPAISASTAAFEAARYVAREATGGRLKLSTRRPLVLAAFPPPSLPTVLSKRPFRGSILASLTVLVNGDGSDLAWDVRFRLPGPGTAYSVLVSAGPRRDARILRMDRLSAHAASGRVFEYDPDVGAVERDWPLTRGRYPRFGDKPIRKAAWVSDDATRGNNVVCVNSDGKPFAGTAAGADLRFVPADDTGVDQWRVNAFFQCNMLHDFFLLLGFDEAAGNFQKQNDPGVGVASDAVDVQVWDDAIDGLAFFVNVPDGSAPTLNLGRLGERHSALDADVVIHEYVHGVTSRVIGGPGVDNPLREPQSRALGEGYSDYFAISLQNYFRRRAGLPTERVYGAWIADKAAGLRNFPYDATFPGTYGSLGREPFKNDHDAGQVWCAALLDVNRALVLDNGDEEAADERGWQLVFDSLRILHPGGNGPTFLHARDALMTQLDAAVAGGRLPPDPALRQRVFDCFVRRKMGPEAESPDAGFQGIKESP